MIKVYKSYLLIGSVTMTTLKKPKNNIDKSKRNFILFILAILIIASLMLEFPTACGGDVPCR